MEASKKNITEIFNRASRLQVPYFQRSYVWDEQQWDRFLEDMEFAVTSNRHYFMGAVILKQLEVPIGETATYTIIDGQQRLTTFVLFFKALFEANGVPEMFANVFTTFQGGHIIEHNHFDRTVFEKVLDGRMDEVTDTEKKTNIYRCYDFFRHEIKPGQIDPNRLFANILFVGISLQYGEDEQQIFDTINSLGVSLTTGELLKNFLFNRDYISYEANWRDVFESDDDTREYWDIRLTTGRVERSNLDLFLQSYLYIKIQDPELGVSSDDKEQFYKVESIFSSYKAFLDRYLRDRTQLVAELKEYAEIYRGIIEPRSTERLIEHGDVLGRLNVLLFGLETATIIPYVLFIAKNQPDADERTKMYQYLEAYIMRRMVTRRSTKNYTNIFRALIGNAAYTLEKLKEYIDQREDASNRMPEDDAVRAAFHTEQLTNKQAKGVLFLIETAIHNTHQSVRLLDFDDYSLEHVMPKKWRNKWSTINLSEDAMKSRDEILLTLGNLTIISSPLNKSLRDADWQTKKKGTSQNSGLELCTQGIVTFSPYLSRDTWDEAVIEARAEELAGHALKIWTY